MFKNIRSRVVKNFNIIILKLKKILLIIRTYYYYYNYYSIYMPQILMIFGNLLPK